MKQSQQSQEQVEVPQDPVPVPIPEPLQKKWYLSWQLWFNLAMTLIFLGEELQMLNWIPTNWTLMITIVGNTILRIVKTQTQLIK